MSGHGAFETTFQFQIHGSPTNEWSDGLTFVLAANPTGLGSTSNPGGDIGYSGVTNSVAVIFDTWRFENTVAVVTDGNLALVNSPLNWANPYGKTGCVTNGPEPALCLADGDVWTAKIKYDGVYLNVWVEDGSNATDHVINNYKIAISSFLGTQTPYVGFTAGTGGGYADYDLLNWKMVY